MAALGIVVDEVEVIERPGVVVVYGRVNVRRFLCSNPGEDQ